MREHMRSCRKINHNIIMLIMTMSTISLLILGGVRHTLSKAEHSCEKSFRAIEVQEGDTLFSIAREYSYADSRLQDYITEVKQINHLHDDRIHSGCFLVVPVYSNGLSSDAVVASSDEK